MGSTRALMASIDHQFGVTIARRRPTLGLLVASAGVTIVTALMLPVRSDLPPGTPALVLLVPVVAGVLLGGLGVAIAGVAIGTLDYAYFFKPPYRSFALTGYEWVDAGAYVAVGLLVAWVVGHTRRLQAEATRAEMLDQVDTFKSALLRAVSHDLRTPLASIKASVSDLLDHSVVLEEADRSYLLGTIESETDRLTRLVSNLLDMSRIDRGALAVQTGPIQLSELIDDVTGRMAGRLTGVPIHVGVDPTEMVEGDYALTAQALANLVDNAVRHGRSADGVTLRSRRAPDVVELDVIDRGPGIPHDGRPRLFEPFYQGPGHSPTGGSGLGLAICRAFLEAQGGQVSVADTDGGGATFTIRLPSFDASEDDQLVEG